jgi:hypothetical protein
MQQNRTANEALIQMTTKGVGKVFVCNEYGKKLRESTLQSDRLFIEIARCSICVRE